MCADTSDGEWRGHVRAGFVFLRSWPIQEQDMRQKCLHPRFTEATEAACPEGYTSHCRVSFSGQAWSSVCASRGGVNGQRGSKPVSLDGPCISPLSSSLTLSDGETVSVQGGMGVGVSPVNLVSSSSQAPAGLAVQQERKEPQNWAQDTQGRAAGFQTRCHLDPFSHPVQSNRALTGGFVTSSTGPPPPPPRGF